MGKIFTATINPAIDKILYLDKFEPAITNRLTGSMNGLGGKGTHVSLNLKALGTGSVATGIAHGKTGAEVIKILENAGLEVSFIHYGEHETRTNYLIIEADGTSTCLSEKGVMLSDDNISDYINLLKNEMHDGDCLVLSGTASNCKDPYIYNRIMDELAYKNVRVFLDASGEALKKCVRNRPFLVKPNRDELEYITGRKIESPADVAEAIKSLDSLEIPVIAVSLGGAGAVVRHYGTYYRLEPLHVNVANTIGCGDCFLAGLIYGMHNGLEIEETLRIASAASAATAESGDSVGFSYERFGELKETAVVYRI